MLKRVACIALLQALTLSCKTASTPKESSDVKTSARTIVIDDPDLKKMPFEFCPEKRSFSLINAQWLVYLASLQYSHFKEVGPALEKLGFGDKGEGNEFLKKWWELRIKRVNEGRLDTDDTWANPQQRVAKEKELAKGYKELFGKDYADDGVNSIASQDNLVGGKSPNAKIQFFSGLSTANGESEKTSTQAFYAEHGAMNLSVVSFRGTEGEEGPDRIADLNLAQGMVEGLGAVHGGMFNAYNEIDSSLLATLRARSKVKPMNLWVTGHSLGASLATLFTARVLQLQAKGDLKNVRLVGVYHIGSPRVFDAAAAKKFDEMIVKQSVNYVRIRNHKDLVTGIPTGIPGVAQSYWHVGALVYMNGDGHITYGDGWETIEKESDIKNSFPSDVGDHDVNKYWRNIKAAKLSSKDKNALSCAAVAGEKPLQPFKENPATR